MLLVNKIDEEEDDEEGGDDSSHGLGDNGDEGDFDKCKVNNNCDVDNMWRMI